MPVLLPGLGEKEEKGGVGEKPQAKTSLCEAGGQASDQVDLELRG